MVTDNKLYKVAITVDGNYVHGKYYDTLTQVYYAEEDGGDGCSYISVKPNQNVIPGTDDTVWKRSSRSGKGEKGDKGDTGERGPQGEKGDPGEIDEQQLQDIENQIAAKQDTLVSGTNIKTIGNQSILGSGNIQVGDENAVKYTEQTLTDAQKTQSRTNIGAGTYSKPSGGIPASDIASGVIPDVSGFYTKPANGIPASDIATGVIPTVPIISTDVSADAASDAKTASPKAVKTYVDGVASAINDDIENINGDIEDLGISIETIGNGAFVVAWDGESTPVAADIPAGVSVTYGGNSYTGSLAASASTIGKIYLVATGTSGNYDRYVTVGDSTYSWVHIGTTSVALEEYATNSKVSQLEAKVYEDINVLQRENGLPFLNGADYPTNTVILTSDDVKAGDKLYFSMTLGQVRVLVGNDTVKYIGSTSGATSNYDYTLPEGFTSIKSISAITGLVIVDSTILTNRALGSAMSVLQASVGGYDGAIQRIDSENGNPFIANKTFSAGDVLFDTKNVKAGDEITLDLTIGVVTLYDSSNTAFKYIGNSGSSWSGSYIIPANSNFAYAKAYNSLTVASITNTSIKNNRTLTGEVGAIANPVVNHGRIIGHDTTSLANCNDADNRKIYLVRPMSLIPTNYYPQTKIYGTDDYEYLYTVIYTYYNNNNTGFGYQIVFDRSFNPIWFRTLTQDGNLLRSFGTWFLADDKRMTIEVGADKFFTKVKDAVEFAYQKGYNFKRGFDVHINAGTYDIISEFGAELTTSTAGIYIGNGTRLLCDRNAKLVCNYTGGNATIADVFSPFIAGNGDFEIVGMNLSCTNVRYCVHDEIGGLPDSVTHIFRNCIMFIDNSSTPAPEARTQCIGGGLGEFTNILVEYCVFDSVCNDNDPVVSYHSTTHFNDAECYIVVRDNYFKHGTVRGGYAGVTPATIKSPFLVSGNSVKSAPFVIVETVGAAENIDFLSWNNEIRN